MVHGKKPKTIQKRDLSKLKVITDIPYAGLPRHHGCFDLYLPDGGTGRTLVIFFYGGGLIQGEKTDLQSLGREMTDAGFLLAAPDYRYYPEVDYPVFIEDAAEAVAYITAHIREYADVSDIFIGGCSAGAYLSMMLCFNKHYLGKHGLDPDDYGGFLFISGQPTAHYEVLARHGFDPRQIVVDESAPLYHIGPSGPPLLICTDTEWVNRKEQNALLEGTLRHFEYRSPVVFRVLDVPHGRLLNPPPDGKSPGFQEMESFFKMVKGGSQL